MGEEGLMRVIIFSLANYSYNRKGGRQNAEGKRQRTMCRFLLSAFRLPRGISSRITRDSAVGLLLFVLLPPLPAQTIGIVTQVQGKVTLTAPGPASGATAGKPQVRTAMLADPLSEGGEVSTGPGASATLLYCPRSVSIRLGPNSSVAFRGGDMKTSGTVSSAPVKYCFVPQAAVTPASQQQAGMIAVRTMGDEFTILSPGPSSRVLPAATFAWSAAPGASAYTVVVTREREEVWRATVRATSVEMPAAGALAPGEAHGLRVAAMKGDEEIASSSVAFQVVPKEEAQAYSEKIRHFRLTSRLPSADATPHLQLALIYEELQDFAGAVREYEEALRFGDSDFIRTRLATLRK